MSIKVGDKVTIVDKADFSPLNGEIGEVLRIYEVNPPVAYVVLESGKAGLKVPLDFLEKVEPESEIPEGAKLITREDFDAALIEANRVMLERTSGDPEAGIICVSIGTLVGANIADKIFKNQDDVIMTEDQFIAELWDGCNPKAVSEIVSNVRGVGRNMDVAISALMCLRQIPDFLFGGSND